MSTPTAGRSMTGRTPQFTSTGTPPVSAGTPLSHLRGSPNGGRKASPSGSGILGNGLGMDFGLGLDSQAMGLSLSQNGMGMLMGGGESVAIGADGEDTKTRRLETMISILNKKELIVTRNNLIKVAQKLGMDCLIDGQNCILAGKLCGLDVHFDNNIVTGTRLDLDQSSELAKGHTNSICAVFFDDLKLGPNQSPLTKTVTKFQRNMERFAALDHIMHETKFDPYDALANMYSALQKIYLADLQREQAAAELNRFPEQAAQNQVLCGRNGIPGMNICQRLGLSVKYWKDRRLILGDDTEDPVYSVLFTCTPAPLGTLPNSLARSSPDWVSPQVFKSPMDTMGDSYIIDWQYPPNSMVPVGESDGPNMGGMKLPEALFKAEFYPPIIVPHVQYTSFIQNIGISAVDANQPVATFAQLLFPEFQGTEFDDGRPRDITTLRQVPCQARDGKKYEVEYETMLYSYKPVQAAVLREAYFSHPSQIINSLPVLRQYAFFGTLLRNSMMKQSQMPTGTQETSSGKTAFVFGGLTTGASNSSVPMATTTSQTSMPGAALFDDDEISLDGKDLDAAPPVIEIEPRNSMTINVDMVLSLQLSVCYTLISGQSASLTVDIGINGVVAVVAENVLGPMGKKKGVDRMGLARALMTLEDFGKWGEWISSRIGFENEMPAMPVNGAGPVQGQDDIQMNMGGMV